MLLWACWCIILCWISDYFLMLYFNIWILSISCAQGLNSLTVFNNWNMVDIFFTQWSLEVFWRLRNWHLVHSFLKVFHNPFQYSISGLAPPLGQENEQKSGILYKWWWWEDKLCVHSLLCVGTIVCMYGCVWMHGFMHSWLCMSTAVCVYDWRDIPVFTGSNLIDQYEFWGC